MEIKQNINYGKYYDVTLLGKEILPSDCHLLIKFAPNKEMVSLIRYYEQNSAVEKTLLTKEDGDFEEFSKYFCNDSGLLQACQLDKIFEDIVYKKGLQYLLKLLIAFDNEYAIDRYTYNVIHTYKEWLNKEIAFGRNVIITDI